MFPESEVTERRRLSTLALLAVVGLAAAGCRARDHAPDVPGVGEGEVQEFEDPSTKHVRPPPWSSPEIYPCTGCHDSSLPPDPKRRALTMAHEEIVLEHDEKHRWCLDCHDKDNRDRLRLASGELVPFEESFRLCGQCHGDKYRDWRAGVHGRRTGQWNGEKEYLLCVDCHYSHDPHFKPLQPKPPPKRPKGGM